MEQNEKDVKDVKDIYYKYASDMWMKNKGRYTSKNGSKSGYYYTCEKEGCEKPRVLNTKQDPEYEINIKSKYCDLHKVAFVKVASKL